MSTNDTNWLERLIDQLTHGVAASQRGIDGFQSRLIGEQRQLSQLTDPDAAKSLRLTIADVESELARIRDEQSQYENQLSHIRAAASASLPAAPSLNRRALGEVKVELKRVHRVFRTLGLEFELIPGPSDEDLQLVEHVTGVKLDDHLRAMWRMSDGSADARWFCVGEVDYGIESATVGQFLSVDSVMDGHWRPLPEALDEEDSDEEAERAEEIQPDFIYHPLWLPFGLMYADQVLQFDGNPTAAGQYGQIIEYEHDPDTIYLIAPSFIEFFRQSNALLEFSVANDRETLLEWLTC